MVERKGDMFKEDMNMMVEQIKARASREGGREGKRRIVDMV